MKWKEFKNRVDAELKRLEITDDVDIDYIDIHGANDEMFVSSDAMGTEIQIS